MIICHLSRLMGERRLRVAPLAKELGLARGTLEGLYHGRTTRYDAAVLDRLCAYFGVGVGELLERRAD